MRSIADRLNAEPAKGWRPEPDDQLVGQVVEVTTGEGQWGPYPIVVVEPNDGTDDVAVHAFHTVLKNEVDGKVEVGDTIGIKYLGVPNGKDYESYRVVIDRTTRAANAGSNTTVNVTTPRESGESPVAPKPSTPPADDEEPF